MNYCGRGLVMFVRLLLQSIELAAAQIWANKVRAVLTTLGIVIGVASVTSVIAALTGLKDKVMADVETFGTNRMFISPDWPDQGPKKNASWRVIRFRPEQFEGLLDHCPSVKHFTRQAGYNESVHYGERTIEGARISGIESPWHEIESRYVLMGRPFSRVDQDQGRRVCLVDPSLRDKLRMDKDPTGEFLIIGRQTYRVIGVVEERPAMGILGGPGDSFEIFIPFQTLWEERQPWFSVMAGSVASDKSEDAKAEVSFFLRQTRALKPGEPDTFRVETMESGIKVFNRIAATVTLVAVAVVCVSLVVGGVGIMNIMLVSVSERTREIGLRKAVGAKNSAILTQFLVEAVVLCCIGGLIGVLAGQGLTSLMASLPGTPLDKAHIPGWAVALSFGFAGSVGIFFGMFPAVKAARLDPIEALRHE